MKIKKNLSDADMLKSFNEKISFENEFSSEDVVTVKKTKSEPKKTNAFLPEEIEEKFSQLMLEIRAQLMKENKINIKWQVKKENNQIIIYHKEKVNK